MDGISNLIGRKTFTRTFAGKEYTFWSMRVLQDHAEKESYILSLRPSAWDMIRDLPPDVPRETRQRLEAQAIDRAGRAQIVSRLEELEFDNSLNGLAYSLWRCLRDHHAEFGMLQPDQSPVYSVGGVGYSLTPAQGVQAAKDFIEKVGDDHHAQLLAIQNGVESPPELKN